MTILALEFSSSRRSVAVLGPDGRTTHREEEGGRSTKAFHLIDGVLSEAQVKRDAIETIAVGLGPGSYTGIRVAISIGQGWRMARGVKLIGLKTPDGLAEQARATGIRGPFHVAIDAQRGEFYHAAYLLADAGFQITKPLRIAAHDELVQKCKVEPLWCDPELIHRFPGAEPVYPDAIVLARLATGEDAPVMQDELEPIYLRAPSFVKTPPSRRVIPD